MKQRGASCRILLRCGLLILTLGILLCGAVRSFGESEPPGNAFDMEEQLIIPTNKNTDHTPYRARLFLPGETNPYGV